MDPKTITLNYTHKPTICPQDIEILGCCPAVSVLPQGVKAPV